MFAVSKEELQALDEAIDYRLGEYDYECKFCKVLRSLRNRLQEQQGEELYVKVE